MVAFVFMGIVMLPLVLMILADGFDFSKKVTKKVVRNFTSPGQYNLQVIQLIDLIKKFRIYHISIVARSGYSQRSIKLKHLDDELRGYQVTNIFIPPHLDKIIYNNFSSVYSDNYLSLEKIKPILLYIIEKYSVQSYTDYPDSKTRHYSLSIQLPPNQRAENIWNEINMLVTKFHTIYWDGEFLEYRFTDGYKKMIRESNWMPQTSAIPKYWWLDKGSRKWNDALIAKITDK